MSQQISYIVYQWLVVPQLEGTASRLPQRGLPKRCSTWAGCPLHKIVWKTRQRETLQLILSLRRRRKRKPFYTVDRWLKNFLVKTRRRPSTFFANATCRLNVTSSFLSGRVTNFNLSTPSEMSLPENTQSRFRFL